MTYVHLDIFFVFDNEKILVNNDIDYENALKMSTNLRHVHR